VRLARWTERHAGAAWFLALALLVAGPLLGSGRLLLLDFPSGPRFPALPAALEPRNEVANTDPTVALHLLAGAVHPLLPDKLFLLAPVLLGGLGVYRFARRELAAGVLPALYGGTVFAINPFVGDRYVSGHLYFLLGYALLPWALGAALDAGRRPRLRAGLVLGLWLAGLAAVSIHAAGAYLLLAATVVLLARGRLRARLACLGGGAALAALLSSFWLLPALVLAPEGAPGETELEAYAARPGGLQAFPALAALHGFWRDEFRPLAEALPVLYVFLLPIVCLAVVGAAAGLRSPRHRRIAAALSASAVLGLLLAASTSFGGGRSALRWTVDLLPVASVYREPQKLLALTALAYAVLGTLGLLAVARGWPSARAAPLRAASLLATAAVLAYGHPLLWGLSGEVRLSHYPASWSAANAVLDDGTPGRLLVLPGHSYSVWSFTGGRIVADPTRSFFAREVVTRRGSGFDGPGAQWREVEQALARARSGKRLGASLATLDVRFVAWLREADWWEYRLLEEQSDLLPIYRGERIVVFENTAWRPGGRPEWSGASPPAATFLGHAVSLVTLAGVLILLRRDRPSRERARPRAPRETAAATVRGGGRRRPRARSAASRRAPRRRV
jgi:hypothetical protein